ncbi:MAG: Uma2 family endonuclease [Acidimicrobiales bacterium]
MVLRGPGVVAFTWVDLQSMPDDGYRRELVDGQLLVTPSPVGRHQNAAAAFHVQLANACPPEHKVFEAPFDWRASDDTVLVPDLVVFRTRDFDPDGPLTATPLLVVEIGSPSTARIDRTLKRDVYERAGVPAYWLVDPVAPSVTVLERRGATYEEVATVRGEQRHDVTYPFPVTLVPARLTA